MLQNRILDRTLAAAVVDLSAADVCGVVHLGAKDASEEYPFLQSVARVFSTTIPSVSGLALCAR